VAAVSAAVNCTCFCVSSRGDVRGGCALLVVASERAICWLVRACTGLRLPFAVATPHTPHSSPHRPTVSFAGPAAQHGGRSGVERRVPARHHLARSGPHATRTAAAHDGLAASTVARWGHPTRLVPPPAQAQADSPRLAASRPRRMTDARHLPRHKRVVAMAPWCPAAAQVAAWTPPTASRRAFPACPPSRSRL